MVSLSIRALVEVRVMWIRRWCGSGQKQLPVQNKENIQYGGHSMAAAGLM